MRAQHYLNRLAGLGCFGLSCFAAFAHSPPLESLRPRSHEPRWTFQFVSRITWVERITTRSGVDYLLAATDAGELRAFAPHGTQRWSAPVIAMPSVRFAGVTEEGFAIVFDDAFVYALAVEADAGLRWKSEPPPKLDPGDGDPEFLPRIVSVAVSGPVVLMARIGQPLAHLSSWSGQPFSKRKSTDLPAADTRLWAAGRLFAMVGTRNGKPAIQLLDRSNLRPVGIIGGFGGDKPIWSAPLACGFLAATTTSIQFFKGGESPWCGATEDFAGAATMAAWQHDLQHWMAAALSKKGELVAWWLPPFIEAWRVKLDPAETNSIEVHDQIVYLVQDDKFLALHSDSGERCGGGSLAALEHLRLHERGYCIDGRVLLGY